MSAMTLEGWCKTSASQKPTPLEDIHFFLSDNDHLRLEQAEEYLQNSETRDVMVDADLDSLDLKMPEGYGPLADCKFRVYLSNADRRGHFHLVGHRASDGSLIYTNAVLIDQLLS
ncbi:hypothetical protein NK639_22940 [Pseudomonas sp. ZM24]|uniref:hypothetical protein n=1 Tax=Pseudomonas triclosanedens TaxID=2961893 RepID=UPI0020C3753F|nr:hypothetical protein [Pseudomonas triclosanedens]MCP8478422.1 hypothetical protein [Pseudomonas triclosanedens]